MASDDMPYERIRELAARGRGEIDPEQLRKARDWQASFAAARELCFAGGCEHPECEGGARCPFRRGPR